MHTFQQFRYLARQFHALGNESRVYILQLLYLRPRTGKELVAALHIRPSNVSKHLFRLMAAGLIQGRRQKSVVVFSLTSYSKKLRFLWRSITENELNG